MKRIVTAALLGTVALASGCSFIGNALGIDWCPVWTPIRMIFGF